MYTAQEVGTLIDNWKKIGMTKSEIVSATAESCMGWPYVFGAAGNECTVSYRRARADALDSSNPGEAGQIRKKCQVLSNKKGSCNGCTFYPNGVTRCYDCRGFTRWLLGRVGIALKGAGATSQWNDDTNWVEKGDIKDMPKDVVCCVFMKKDNKMSHTGMYVGDNRVIHCSGTVKEGKPTDRGWTHYAIPKGLEGTTPVYPTIRKGSSGEYVKIAQQRLHDLGYNIGDSGADGKFGKQTQAAVKQFQRDWNLKQDGVIGPATWGVLLSAPVREKSYSVTIHGLDLTQATAISNNYPGSTISEEVSK